MAAETIPTEAPEITLQTKPIVTEDQTIEILLIIAPEQVLPLQEIKTILSAILTEEQAQTAIEAKATILQDLTPQAQEATVILQLPDPIARPQAVPATAVAAEADHLAEAEEDNFYIYFEQKKLKLT